MWTVQAIRGGPVAGPAHVNTPLDPRYTAGTLPLEAGSPAFALPSLRPFYAKEPPMTLAGWVTMSVSLACVWGLVIWCYRRILQSPQQEKAPPGFGP